MKTKREWVASAIILLGSGSILSAAALATSPASEKNVPANTAATQTPAAPEIAHVSDEALQAAADEPAVQVVTGDLANNEFYIFADNQAIPERLLDEHPDASFAVLGADEKKAAEKTESFNNTAKLVAERREKARIIAAVKAEADYQKLRDWHGGMVELSRNPAASEKSALPIQQHIYPHTMQLANLPDLVLSGSEEVLVRQALKQAVDAASQQVNEQPVTQALSMNGFGNIAHHPKVILTRHTLHRYAFLLPNYLNVVPVMPAGQIVTENSKPTISSPARELPIRVAAKLTQPAEVAKPTKMADEMPSIAGNLSLPINRLHRYAFYLPEHLNMDMASTPRFNVPAAVSAKASAVKAQAGVVGSAFANAELNMATSRKQSGLSLTGQYQRRSVLAMNGLNVTPRIPQIPTLKTEQKVAVPAANFVSAPVVNVHLANASHTVVKTVTPRAVEVAVKTALASSAKEKRVTARTKNQAHNVKPKSQAVNMAATNQAPIPRQHKKIHPAKAQIAAREHALTALEHQLAAEPAPVFHQHRVATKRIDEPRPIERDDSVDRNPVRHRQYAEEFPFVDEVPRPERRRERDRGYEVASIDHAESSQDDESRYRRWRNPAGFGKMMME